MELELVEGDITTQEVDAIVNAANSSLLGGGGVDGAIHRAGGPEILAACRALRATTLPNGLPTGDAIATPAGRLNARYVIHTVGPVWDPADDRSALLAAAYRNSLRVAASLDVDSIAFPAISAGVYGWPLADAATIAVRTVRAEAPSFPVRFVVFNRPAAEAFRIALAS
ncbi:O-acetyl-ADP-ribose deacetylase [Mycetocola sp.]|uniref:O-acetyl-ADP-ribose deacetylase n=1 Tax=Mycetocola sp. TaxID=1871042 RepID=UPI003989E97D